MLATSDTAERGREYNCSHRTAKTFHHRTLSRIGKRVIIIFDGVYVSAYCIASSPDEGGGENYGVKDSTAPLPP